MVDTNRNIERVKGIYKNFGEGAIGSIIECLHEDVEWEMEATDHGVPWLSPGRGRAHVIKFFQALGAMELKGFEVLSIMGDKDLVVALINIEFVHPTTRKTVRERMEAHVWRLNEAGAVTGMRHCADTHQHVLAAGLS